MLWSSEIKFKIVNTSKNIPHNNEKLKFIICSTVYCKTEETILEKYEAEQLNFVGIPQRITTFYEERRSSTEHSIKSSNICIKQQQGRSQNQHRIKK